MTEKSLILAQPDQALEFVINAISTDPKLQNSTKLKYIQALVNYTRPGNSILDSQQLKEYALTASGSTKSFLKAGIRKFALALEQEAKSGAGPENIATTQAIIWRAQALMNSIHVEKPKGEKVHNWLSAPELKNLISQTRKNGSSLIEIRDRVALGLLSNSLLRRSESVSIKFSDIKERDGYSILQVVGKGAKTRGVKLSAGLAQDIKSLKRIIGAGYILRPILKRKKCPPGYKKIGEYFIGKNITAQAIYNLVLKYGKMIKKPDLQAHDLRRTGSRIAWLAKVPIEQISMTLGHEKIETTVLYLGIKREWMSQPCDHIPY